MQAQHIELAHGTAEEDRRGHPSNGEFEASGLEPYSARLKLGTMERRKLDGHLVLAK
jgi:hypothetical protein